jgi:hypothetical protein
MVVAVSDARSPLDAVIDHLVRTTPLSRPMATRVVEDVLAAFSEELEPVVRRRHRALQRDGLANDAIFAQIGQELALLRFPPPALTQRQLRRIVYG